MTYDTAQAKADIETILECSLGVLADVTVTQPQPWCSCCPVFLLSVCWDTAQAVVFHLMSMCWDTAQAMVFHLMSMCWDTAKAMVFHLMSMCWDTAQAMVFLMSVCWDTAKAKAVPSFVNPLCLAVACAV